MGKFILGVMCMVLSVLLVGHPVDAAWWDIKATLLCVQMTDILISNPEVPGSRSVDLDACWYLVEGQPAQGLATIIWTTGADGDYLYRESYTLAPGDLVINTKLTKATLKLPDGLITWTADTDGDLRISKTEDLLRLDGYHARGAYESTSRFATATGTLAGATFDARQAGGTAYGTTIERIVTMGESGVAAAAKR